jgi:type IV fimbrial biogenesis protein FimT
MVELMVTVAVLAVVMAIAFPSFTALVNGNRLTGNANELLAALQTARSEAVTRNTTVVLCRSNNSTSCATGATWNGWITQVVASGAVLRVNTVKAPLLVSAGPGISGNTDRVVFRSDGFARDATGVLLDADFAVCIPTDRPVNNQRLVSIDGGSRISVVNNVNYNGAGLCPAPL